MNGSFDSKVDLSRTGSVKWEMVDQSFGVEGLLPMWVADMDFRGPSAVIEALKKRAEVGVFGYTAKPDFLYEAVAGWLDQRHGWKVSKEWICYSPGVIAALRACVSRFTSPGDRIIIQPPVYPPFFNVVKENERELVLNPLKLVDGKYEMDFDDLREKARSSQAKMLILCSPHNPIGRVWTRKELETLAGICNEHELLVLSDEIHSDLVYKPNRQLPFASISPELESRTIVCMAPSKTFNMAGLQASFILIPNSGLRESFNDYMLKAHLTAINPFSLTAADAAYRHGGEWLDSCLDYIHGNVRYLKERLQTRLSELQLIEPEGTYLAWIDCRSLGKSPDELQQFMLKNAKIAVNAGSSFGEEGAGFIRMNLAAPRAVLEEALSRIEKAVQDLKTKNS